MEREKNMDGTNSYLTTIGYGIVILGVLVLVLAQIQDEVPITDIIRQVLSHFSFLKLVYTLIILSIVMLLLIEVQRIWVENKNRLGAFHYFEEGGENVERGKEIVLRIADRHTDLLRKFADVKQSDLLSEQRLVPTTGEPIKRAKSVLQDIDITVQKINVTDILARLRHWVSAPKEIIGTISKTGGNYRASIELSENLYKLADGSQIGKSIHFDALGGIDDVAFEIACTLIWLDAAQQAENIAAIGRQEFCDWTRQWSRYLNLSRKLDRTGSLPEVDIEQVKGARQSLTQAINNGASFPKFWSLRADFVELLPKETRDKLLLEQQRDELEYLTRLHIDAKERLKDGGEDEKAKAYEALARARPALLIKAGKLRFISQKQDSKLSVEPLWKRLFELDSSKKSVRKVALATGLFRIRVNTQKLAGTPHHPAMGVAIGEGLIATTAYNILEPALKSNQANQVVAIPDEVEADFVFADQWPSDGDKAIKRHRIKRIYYTGESDSAQLALLEIERHDIAAFPPLEIDLDALKNLGLRGFVCLVGFPEIDFRIPEEFMQTLLGPEGGGHKRVMPGRVVSLPPVNADKQFSLIDQNGIIVDASTSGGTGGAPLIDLVSGKLVGINFAGRWQNLEDGKFAYVAPFDWLFPSKKLTALIREEGVKITMNTLVNQLEPGPKRSQDEVLAKINRPEFTISDQAGIAIEYKSLIQNTDGYNSDFLYTKIPLPLVVSTKASHLSQEMHYPNFSIMMNTAPDRRMAIFSAENVDGDQLGTVTRRRFHFRPDPRLDPGKQPENELFRNNILDRGSLVRRANVSWGDDQQRAEQAAEATYFYTNVTPQLSELNQRTWFQLEEELLKYVRERKIKASFFSGPIFDQNDPEYRGIKIPQAYWKIMVVDIDSETTLAIGYMLEQETIVTGNGNEITGRAAEFDVINSQLDIVEIEALTGLDFGPLSELPTLKFR